MYIMKYNRLLNVYMNLKKIYNVSLPLRLHACMLRIVYNNDIAYMHNINAHC